MGCHCPAETLHSLSTAGRRDGAGQHPNRPVTALNQMIYRQLRPPEVVYQDQADSGVFQDAVEHDQRPITVSEGRQIIVAGTRTEQNDAVYWLGSQGAQDLKLFLRTLVGVAQEDVIIFAACYILHTPGKFGEESVHHATVFVKSDLLHYLTPLSKAGWQTGMSVV